MHQARDSVAPLGAAALERWRAMIDRREVLESASTLGLLPAVVEKDYVLGWVLAGINAHPALAESWVFKGGTCLKKMLFRDLPLLRRPRFHAPRRKPSK